MCTPNRSFILKLIVVLAGLGSGIISQANVLGEMQTFSPNTDGFDFITVHSPRQPPKGYFAFSNFANFAKNVILVYPGIPTSQVQRKYYDSLLEYDFGVAYNFTDSFQITFQAPVLLDHSSEFQDGLHIDLTKGVHSYRPGLKWTIDGGEFPEWAILASLDFPNVEDSPYTGTVDKPIPNLEGVHRWRWGSYTHAINVGGRYREPTARPVNSFMFPLRSQVTASYALAKQYSEKSRWVFEVFSSYPLDKKPYNDAMDASSLDILLGVKHRWFKNLNIDYGATVEPGIKTLAPDWRVFAGLVYYWQAFGSATPIAAAGSSAFKVYPARTVVGPGDKVTFTTDPGQEIKTCRVLSGEGQVREDCYYTATDQPGIAQIEFVNDKGVKATSIVETKAAPAPTESLSIYPQSPNVSAGGNLQFGARGGSAPYTYEIQSGGGEMSPTGTFNAPLKPASVTALVRDANGATASTVISVNAIPKADITINLQNLTFIYATAEFTPESANSFNHNIQQLHKVKIRSVIVEGHTDNKGKDAYNMDLSRQRANTAKQALIRALDLAPEQVEAVGFGETAPIATNNTAKGRQKNRRVVLKVYYRK